METQTMWNPAGLRASQTRLSRPGPMAPQVTFAAAWTAMLAFCFLTWAAALALAL
jgi:hypothetical protein